MYFVDSEGVVKRPGALEDWDRKHTRRGGFYRLELSFSDDDCGHIERSSPSSALADERAFVAASVAPVLRATECSAALLDERSVAGPSRHGCFGAHISVPRQMAGQPLLSVPPPRHRATTVAPRGGGIVAPLGGERHNANTRVCASSDEAEEFSGRALAEGSRADANADVDVAGSGGGGGLQRLRDRLAYERQGLRDALSLSPTGASAVRLTRPAGGMPVATVAAVPIATVKADEALVEGRSRRTVAVVAGARRVLQLLLATATRPIVTLSTSAFAAAAWAVRGPVLGLARAASAAPHLNEGEGAVIYSSRNANSAHTSSASADKAFAPFPYASSVAVCAAFQHHLARRALFGFSPARRRRRLQRHRKRQSAATNASDVSRGVPNNSNNACLSGSVGEDAGSEEGGGGDAVEFYWSDTYSTAKALVAPTPIAQQQRSSAVQQKDSSPLTLPPSFDYWEEADAIAAARVRLKQEARERRREALFGRASSSSSSSSASASSGDSSASSSDSEVGTQNGSKWRTANVASVSPRTAAVRMRRYRSTSRGRCRGRARTSLEKEFPELFAPDAFLAAAERIVALSARHRYARGHSSANNKRSSSEHAADRDRGGHVGGVRAMPPADHRSSSTASAAVAERNVRPLRLTGTTASSNTRRHNDNACNDDDDNNVKPSNGAEQHDWRRSRGGNASSRGCGTDLRGGGGFVDVATVVEALDLDGNAEGCKTKINDVSVHTQPAAALVSTDSQMGHQTAAANSDAADSGGCLRWRPAVLTFSKTFRRLFFNIATETFLNSGSYGSAPHCVLRARREWEALEHRDPQRWRSGRCVSIRRANPHHHPDPSFSAATTTASTAQAQAHDGVSSASVASVTSPLHCGLQRVKGRLAALVNTQPKDMCLLVNCNAALTTVLKALPWAAGDTLLLLSCDYDATFLQAAFLEETYGVEVIIVPITPPMGDEMVCRKLSAALEELYLVVYGCGEGGNGSSLKSHPRSTAERSDYNCGVGIDKKESVSAATAATDGGRPSPQQRVNASNSSSPPSFSSDLAVALRSIVCDAEAEVLRRSHGVDVAEAHAYHNHRMRQKQQQEQDERRPQSKHRQEKRGIGHTTTSTPMDSNTEQRGRRALAALVELDAANNTFYEASDVPSSGIPIPPAAVTAGRLASTTAEVSSAAPIRSASPSPSQYQHHHHHDRLRGDVFLSGPPRRRGRHAPQSYGEDTRPSHRKEEGEEDEEEEMRGVLRIPQRPPLPHAEENEGDDGAYGSEEEASGYGRRRTDYRDDDASPARRPNNEARPRRHKKERKRNGHADGHNGRRQIVTGAPTIAWSSSSSSSASEYGSSSEQSEDYSVALAPSNERGKEARRKAGGGKGLSLSSSLRLLPSLPFRSRQRGGGFSNDADDAEGIAPRSSSSTTTTGGSNSSDMSSDDTDGSQSSGTSSNGSSSRDDTYVTGRGEPNSPKDSAGGGGLSNTFSLHIPLLHDDAAAAAKRKKKKAKAKKAKAAEAAAAPTPTYRHFTAKTPPRRFPRLFSFSHVTSRHGWVFPARAMTTIAHNYGLLVCVDGAQAVGHLPVDIPRIGCDFYMGTGHKWLYTMPGTAFLAVAPAVQPLIWPLAAQSAESEWATDGAALFSSHEHYNDCRRVSPLLGKEEGGFNSSAYYDEASNALTHLCPPPAASAAASAAAGVSLGDGGGTNSTCSGSTAFEARFAAALPHYDASTFLAMEQSFGFLDAVCGGTDAVMARGEALAVAAIAHLTRAWGLAEDLLWSPHDAAHPCHVFPLYGMPEAEAEGTGGGGGLQLPLPLLDVEGWASGAHRGEGASTSLPQLPRPLLSSFAHLRRSSGSNEQNGGAASASGMADFQSEPPFHFLDHSTVSVSAVSAGPFRLPSPNAGAAQACTNTRNGHEALGITAEQQHQRLLMPPRAVTPAHVAFAAAVVEHFGPVALPPLSAEWGALAANVSAPPALVAAQTRSGGSEYDNVLLLSPQQRVLRHRLLTLMADRDLVGGLDYLSPNPHAAPLSVRALLEEEYVYAADKNDTHSCAAAAQTVGGGTTASNDSAANQESPSIPPTTADYFLRWNFEQNRRFSLVKAATATANSASARERGPPPPAASSGANASDPNAHSSTTAADDSTANSGRGTTSEELRRCADWYSSLLRRGGGNVGVPSSSSCSFPSASRPHAQSLKTTRLEAGTYAAASPSSSIPLLPQRIHRPPRHDYDRGKPTSALPLLPLPQSRGCTAADAAKLMGFLLTSGLTVMIVVVEDATLATHVGGSALTARLRGMPPASARGEVKNEEDEVSGQQQSTTSGGANPNRAQSSSSLPSARERKGVERRRRAAMSFLAVRVSCSLVTSADDVAALAKAISALGGRYGALDMARGYLPVFN